MSNVANCGAAVSDIKIASDYRHVSVLLFSSPSLYAAIQSFVYLYNYVLPIITFANDAFAFMAKACDMIRIEIISNIISIISIMYLRLPTRGR